MDRMPNKDEIQKFMDDGVLDALREIEESMKDGSLASFIMSNNHATGTLPYRQYVFQVSLLHQKQEKKNENINN